MRAKQNTTNSLLSISLLPSQLCLIWKRIQRFCVILKNFKSAIRALSLSLLFCIIYCICRKKNYECFRNPEIWLHINLAIRTRILLVKFKITFLHTYLDSTYLVQQFPQIWRHVYCVMNATHVLKMLLFIINEMHLLSWIDDLMYIFF